VLTRIKQWLCSHRYDLADLVGRDAKGNVSCACHKCGKVSRADCGLHLPGYFDRNSTGARVQAAQAAKRAADSAATSGVGGPEHG
jgi:hypothetical protein